jgi:uncharacterized membrane protein affecting hemolysin expression
MKRGDHPRFRSVLVMIVFAVVVLAAMATQYARMRAQQTPSTTTSEPRRR